MNSSTRSKTTVYLVGSTKEALSESKLPSIEDVLRVYLYRVKMFKTKHEAAISTIKEVQIFCEKARITTHRIDHATKELEELVSQWEGLKKNKLRRTETQIANEETFTDCFNDLFDVAHQDALTTMENEEDKQFLQKQREKRRQGSMVGADLLLMKKQKNTCKKTSKSAGLERKAECHI